MPRPRITMTATEKITGVIRWADRQGLPNIAAELRAALDLLPAELAGAGSRRTSPHCMAAPSAHPIIKAPNVQKRKHQPLLVRLRQLRRRPSQFTKASEARFFELHRRRERIMTALCHLARTGQTGTDKWREMEATAKLIAAKCLGRRSALRTQPTP